MITPKFELAQNDMFVILTMHVPYIKVSDSEIYIEGTEFKFYLKPYYLRLNFSSEITEDGTEKAQYDVEKGDILVHIPKKDHGNHFEDLDMISKLLAPKKVKPIPSIEVLNEQKNLDITYSEEDDFNWDWDQDFPQELDFVHVYYGFCNEYSNYYGPLVSEFPDLVELTLPDQCPSQNRKALLDDNLLASFDMEHYISDFMDINEFVGDVIHYQPRYLTNPDKFSLVSDEQVLLCQLPPRHIHVKKENLKSTMIGLVDVLYSFIFDHLINCGEVSVESAWNICKLSSQLSWLYNPSTLRECLILNFSRSLTFPLYRHFDFCSRVLEDIKFIISGGRSRILKCLLGIYDILRTHEFYYLHNKVFITNYCLWIQNVKDKHIEKLSETLNSMQIICKSDLPFPLEDFEALIVSESSEGSDCDTSSEYESDSSIDEHFFVTEPKENSNKNENEYTKAPLTSFKETFSEQCRVTSLSTAIGDMSITEDNYQNLESDCVQKPLIEELDIGSNST